VDPSGTGYPWTETDVLAGMRYRYYLERVALDGRATLYGAVSVRIPDSRLYLRLIQR